MTATGRRGFTLLEIMVSLAILATAMVALLQNHGSSIILTERSRNVSVAINLAKDMMTDIETYGWPEIGQWSGDFQEMYPDLYPGFRWEQEVAENVFWTYVREVYVRVYWREGTIEQKVELVQYIAAMDSDQQKLAQEESSGDDDTAGGAKSDEGGGALGKAMGAAGGTQ